MEQNVITIDVRKHPAVVRYAQAHNMNVQKLVDDYLASFYEEEALSQELAKLPAEVRSLCGIASDLQNYRDLKDERFNYLMDKYK